MDRNTYLLQVPNLETARRLYRGLSTAERFTVTVLTVAFAFVAFGMTTSADRLMQVLLIGLALAATLISALNLSDSITVAAWARWEAGISALSSASVGAIALIVLTPASSGRDITVALLALVGVGGIWASCGIIAPAPGSVGRPVGIVSIAVIIVGVAAVLARTSLDVPGTLLLAGIPLSVAAFAESRRSRSVALVGGMAAVGFVRSFSRLVFLIFTAYLLIADSPKPAILIVLVLMWGLGEGFSLPLWTSFLAGMVSAGERGRWISMRAQAATLSTLPVLVAILLLVLLATKEQALPLAYSVAAIGGVVSWFSLRRMFAMSDVQAVPPKRSLRHVPESPEARQFLGGVFMFWFASALTWPIIARYLTNELNAPTAYFAVSGIIGATIGILIQPRWGTMADLSGASRILLISCIGSAIVPLLWAFVPSFWFGFAVDSIAFLVWPGHMLGLTLRAVELVDHEADRPMMIGWTNLAQGAGASISPLIAAIAVNYTGVSAILLTAFALRFASAFIISGKVTLGRKARPSPA